MKIDKKFDIYPSREDVLKIVFPINLKIGTIFTGEGKWGSLHYEENQPYCQFLRKVTKIEPLTLHPNHLIISSVIVGAIISRNIYKKTKSSFWGGVKGVGESKFAVAEYYDAEYLKAHYSLYDEDEKVEIFFISTDGTPKYYVVDLVRLDCVKVPITQSRNNLFYFYF